PELLDLINEVGDGQVFALRAGSASLELVGSQHFRVSENRVHVGFRKLSDRRTLHGRGGTRQPLHLGRFLLGGTRRCDQQRRDNQGSLVHAFYSAGVLQYCQPMPTLRLTIVAALAALTASAPFAQQRVNTTLTAVPGIKVGHSTL